MHLRSIFRSQELAECGDNIKPRGSRIPFVRPQQQVGPHAFDCVLTEREKLRAVTDRYGF
jgi:hypothetical protein